MKKFLLAAIVLCFLSADASACFIRPFAAMRDARSQRIHERSVTKTRTVFRAPAVAAPACPACQNPFVAPKVTVVPMPMPKSTTTTKESTKIEIKKETTKK